MCEDCFSIIEVLENDYCPFCFPPKITPGGKTCPSCQKNHFLDGLICASSLENIVVKKTIHLFKYPPFLKELSRHLSFLIINHLKLTNNELKFRNFIIAPIPIAKKRLSFRGFNQSEEIAKELSLFFKTPVLTNILLKIKETFPQVSLSLSQRKENLKNAFYCQNPEKIKNKTGASPGDLLLFVADDRKIAASVLGQLRLHLAELLKPE